MTDQSQKRLICVSDACTRYGVSRSTIYRLVDRQQIRLIKIGRASRLDIHEIDHFFGIAEGPSA